MESKSRTKVKQTVICPHANECWASAKYGGEWLIEEAVYLERDRIHRKHKSRQSRFILFRCNDASCPGSNDCAGAGFAYRRWNRWRKAMTDKSLARERAERTWLETTYGAIWPNSPSPQKYRIWRMTCAKCDFYLDPQEFRVYRESRQDHPYPYGNLASISHARKLMREHVCKVRAR